MKIKAIAFDLDGSLLQDNHEISERNYQTVKKLENQGYTIILATGRSYEALKRYKDTLAVTTPVICYNGACIMSGRDDTLMKEYVLDDGIARILVKQARENSIHFHGFMNTDLLFEHRGKEAEAYYHRSGLYGRVVDFDVIENLEFTKAMYIGDHDRLEVIQSTLMSECGDRIYTAFSTPFFLEVMKGGVSKAAALLDVLQTLNISTEEVMAFGDGHNDIEMLKECGHGVLMGNAPAELHQIPGLYKTVTNEEDGVAAYLEEYFGL